MKRALPVGVFAAVMAIAMPTAAHASATPPAPPSPENVQIFTGPSGVMPEKSPTGTNTLTAAGICTAFGIVDYVHISTSTPSAPRAAQSHGAWNKGNCSATLADVTTQIDRKNPIGLFQAVGTQGKKRLPSEPSMGLPSSNRVTARYACNGTAKAPFRSWTSFDMVGIADTQTPTYSPATGNIDCG